MEEIGKKYKSSGNHNGINNSNKSNSEKSLGLLPNRILFILLLIFSMCSLKLCAEDMTPAQAQVAREKFVAETKKYVGAPYVLGATGPDSFDCSGLVYYVAKQALGLQIPRTAKAIYNYCKIVSGKEREVGDLVFFKTNNSAPITHVGIYIGNNQFISAISDGPNTGVIISSLNQEYWKPKYVATGKLLPSGIPSSEKIDESDMDNSSGGTFVQGTYKGSSYFSPGGRFLDSLVLDGTLTAGWSLFKPNQFMINFRGVDLMTNIRMANIILEPGIGLGFRINTALGIFQIPLVLSFTINDYVRIYGGPVFSFGTSHMIGTGTPIMPSIFPGIIGTSFSTPHINIKNIAIQFVQDISYTVFNNFDNSALSFFDSISAGFVFYSGIRVTLGKKVKKS